MLVDNQKMLSFLSDTDVEKYYHICNDIISSGEDYSLREVVFFCLEENPSDVFVCLRRYDDGECLISAYTDNCELVVEAIEYCKNAKLVTDNNLYGHQNRCELFTDTEDLIEALKQHYVVTPSERFRAPSYYIRSVEDIHWFPITDNTVIRQLTPEISEEIRTQMLASGVSDKSDDYDDEHLGLWGLQIYGDDVNYLLGIKDSSCEIRWIGYLRTEKGFGNYMDIGFLFVNVEFRGHGYAKQLVSHFTRECLKNGKIPRYSFALNPESEGVAKVCGFTQKSFAKHRVMIEI